MSEFGASAPGEIARLAGLVEPDVGVVLMVGMAHAGGFGGIEATFEAKSELVRALRPGGLAVLNADDARVAAMAPIADERDVAVRWFGRGASADVRADDVEVTADGTRCIVTADGASRAAAPARARRAPRHERPRGDRRGDGARACRSQACVARLETVEIAERWRMQPLGSDRVRIINDAYNASPDSMSAALRTLAQITGPGERTVAVLGAMSELGEYADEEHDRVGLLAVRLGIQRIVVVGAGARRMYLEAIAQGSWDGEAVFFATADEAYDYLHGRAARRRPRAREVLQLGGSAVPGRSSGRILLVRSLLTAAAISLAFTLFLTPVFLRLFRKWGWGQVIRTPEDVHNPEPRREARHAHDGRHDLHRRHDRRLPRRHLHRQQPADHLGPARGLDDGRLRRGRLHRRLHEGAAASAASV